MTLGIMGDAPVSRGGELDDLSCSSKLIVKLVRKLAKQDFVRKVGNPNKLYDIVKAIRTQSPGVCVATYDYQFGPPRGYHSVRSRGDFLDWFGDKIELVYDYQVTDDGKDVVVHAYGFNWTEAHYGLPRPDEQR